jgi:Zn-finger nucleic acid-binding protein
MECRSCGANIPPEWVHAIQANICPGCGGEIMDSSTEELLKELSDAMERMPNDPQGVAGWLLSNYRFQKVGEAKPTERFHRKVSHEFDESKIKIDPDHERFLKRTDVYNKIKTQSPAIQKAKQAKNGKIAQLAQAISGAPDPYSDVLNDESDEDISSDEQNAYEEMKKAGLDPFAETANPLMADFSQPISMDDFGLSDDTDGELLPQERILASTSEGVAVLQKNRLKRIKAQDAFQNGGGVFTRS